METAVKSYVFGTAGLTLSLTGSLSNSSWLAPIQLSYTFTFPKLPGGKGSTPIKCFKSEKPDIQTSGVLFGNCLINIKASLYMTSPVPFDLSCSGADFTIYFDDPTGINLLGYSGKNNILFGKSVNVFAPVKTLTEGGLVKIPISVNGVAGSGWNEVCARAANLFYLNNDLAVNIREGIASFKIQNFIFSLLFELNNLVVDKNAPPSDCTAYENLPWS